MARKRFQRGQLLDRGDRWMCRFREDFTHPITGEVRRIRKTEFLAYKSECPTKRLAQRRLDDRLKEINSEEYRPLTPTTFATFAEKWKTSVMIHQKPSSQISSRSIVDANLIPTFGSLTMREINAERVQEFVNGWKLSPKTLRNVIVQMMGMWDYAVAWGYASHNPFPRGTSGKLLLALPKQDRGNTYNFTLDEALAIINAATGHWKLWFRVLAETGMRPGELAGVRRTDLSGRKLSVVQSAYKRKLQTPKTGNAVRTFSISEALSCSLSEYIEQTKGLPNHHNLIFTEEDGLPIDTDKMVKDVLEPILEKLKIREKLDELGVKRCGNYAFRHMNITEQRRLGVPLKTIQKRVGHAIGSAVTDDFYVHAIDADDLAASDMLGEMLNTSTEGAVQ